MIHQLEITKTPLKALKITQPKPKKGRHTSGELQGKCGLGTGLLTRLRLEESSHPLTNQLCYYHEGRGEKGPCFFPTRKTAGTAWIITPPPRPNFSTKGPLQLFSPISLPLLSTTPATAPNKQFNRKIISPKSFISITTYFHFRKQRECTCFQSLLHYTCDQNMHRKDRLLLYFYQTTDAPQGKGYKAKSVNIPSHQGQLLNSFAKRYIVMCFFSPPPPKACGF